MPATTNPPLQGPLADLPPLPDVTLQRGTEYQCNDYSLWFYLAIAGGVQTWRVGGGTDPRDTAIYANPVTGDDANPGTLAKPVRTFQKVHSLLPASPGSEVDIMLAAGTYDDIAPGSGEYDYTFGAMASSNGPLGNKLAQAQINIIGEMVPFAGPFVLAAPSDPSGTTIQVTAAPGVDDWEGLSLIITDSPDASLIDTSRMIAENDGAGNVRWLFPYGGQIPAGTTVYVARAGSVLPASNDVGFFNNGLAVYWSGVKIQRTGASMYLSIIQGGGQFFFSGGCEIDGGPGDGGFGMPGQCGTYGCSPGLEFVFMGRRINTRGNSAYIHVAQFGFDIIGTRSSNHEPAYVSFDSAVLRHVYVNVFSGGGISAELTMLDDAVLESDTGGTITTAACESKNQDVVNNPLPYIVNPFHGCPYVDFFSTFNGWVANAVRGNVGAVVLLVGTSGAAAGGATGYGIRLGNGSTAALDAGVSVTNGGQDIVLEDPAGDVVVTYAGLAVTTFAPPAAIPSLCRVALL